MRRSSGRLLLAVLLVLCLAVPSMGIAAAPEAAPLVQDQTATNGMIRVWLSSIRSNTTYNLTVAGTYTLGGQTLSNGSKVKVEFSGGTVYVTANGTRSAMGSRSPSLSPPVTCTRAACASSTPAPPRTSCATCTLRTTSTACCPMKWTTAFRWRP